MYVCIVARGIPTLQYKMNGIFEYDQAKALAATGNKVVYLALDLRSVRRRRKWGITRLHQDGMIIYSINIPVGAVPNRLLCAVGKRALRLALKKVIEKEGKPDVIHAHFIQQAYMTAYIAEEYDIPFVTTEHSDDVNRENIASDIYAMADYAYKKATRVVAVSQALKRHLDSKFNIDCRVVSNIISFDCFQLIPFTKHEEFRFISVGGLVPGKRMDLLVESFHRAFADESSVELVIFGEGNERVKLEKVIADYGLQERVILKGLQTREAIYQEMKNCQCFVLASEAETFGVAYVEAMAAGLPVIATSCGGPEEFVDEENGILVSVNNVEELTDALQKMKNSIEQYNAEQISRRITLRYSNESIVEKLLLIYREIIGDKQ